MRCASPTPVPASGWRSWARARWACWLSRVRAGMGAEDVALEARHPHQQEAGERLGAHIGTSGTYDVVVEAAGSPESLAQCAQLVGPRGIISVLGVHFGPVQLDWMPLFFHEASVIPSLGYCAHDGVREFEEAAAMLAEEPEIAAHRHHPPIPD